MAKIVVGIFSNTGQAESAIRNLDNLSYNPNDISVVAKDVEKNKSLKETGAKIGAGTASGVATGAIVGGLAGLLSSSVIPGLGAFFIGGPISGALGITGTAASVVSGASTGAAAGGILGALTGWGISESEAKDYQQSIEKGGILVAVPAREGEEDNVTDLLKDEGAYQLKSFDLKDTGEGGFYEYSMTNPGSGGQTQTPEYAYSKGGKATSRKNKKYKSKKI